MKRELILGGALANTRGAVSTEEFLNFLSLQIPNIQFYQLRPRPKTITFAAIDWQAILTTAASIIYIGEALWKAYKKFIKPIREKNPNSSADLYIHIKTEKEKSEQFMIGKNFDNKDAFIKAFEASVKKLGQQSINEKKMYVCKEEIRKSDIWIEVKRTPSTSI